jgi:plastocyanin
MGGRFISALVVVFGAAVAIGVLAARNQTPSAVAVAPTPLSSPVPTPAPNQVEILPDPANSSTGLYQPALLNVHVGQTVTWVNLDDKAHTAVADSGAFTTPVIGPNETATWVPKKTGTYVYGDYLHPEMHGTIVVTP